MENSRRVFTKHKPMIAIVLVNWNGCDLTLKCIDSIKRSSLLPDWIIVVDNASVDDSVTKIKSLYPDVILIQNNENVGFGEGNNIGARKAIDLGATYIWLLNNDTLISDNCIHKLLSATKHIPNAACYTTKIYYEDSPDMLWYDGGSWHPIHKSAVHINQKKIDLNPQDDSIVFTEYISGCSMFLPAETIKKYGLFCGTFVAYNEDADFCMRIKNNKQKLCYVKGAKIWHKVSASLKKNFDNSATAGIPPYGLFLMVRNNLWTIRRNYSLLPCIILVGINTLITFKICIIFFTKRDLIKVKYILKGLRYGLFYPLSKLSSQFIV